MMGRDWKGFIPALVATVLLFVLSPEDLLAQAGGPPSFRPFWHVFVAYAIAWLLVLGWLISIARRLGRVEERLGRQVDQSSA
jgi:CcmD family protein